MTQATHSQALLLACIWAFRAGRAALRADEGSPIDGPLTQDDLACAAMRTGTIVAKVKAGRPSAKLSLLSTKDDCMFMFSWLWLALLLVLFLPIGYGWSYRGWGPPYPSYVQRRRMQQASATGGTSPFNHQAWGWRGDFVWVLFPIVILCLAALFCAR